MMTDASALLNLSADRPITSLKDDLLGRGHFAISLANAICSWNGTESVVVALYGPWGSGKSSVKNMVVSLLKQTEHAPVVVEFNPWEWSGNNRLLEVFFDEIETAIRKDVKSADASELSKKWKKYSTRLSLGGTALEHLKTLTEVTGIPWMPMVLGTLSSTLKKSSEFGQEVAEAQSATAEAEEESLATLKASLHDALSRLPSPVLVVIDDVDRLHPQEIRTLFRLVKVNADFPNMIYLLLFDRQIVEKALNDASGDTGKNYMEKIVQAGFDLPRIEQSALDQALGLSLDNLIGTSATARTFDERRWSSLYRNGLRHYCSSLRNIRRFVSSLSFQIGLYFRDSVLEVNIVDLIGLEAIRVFEPTLYHKLGENAEIIFGYPLAFSRDRESREDKSKKASHLLSFASESNREASMGILRELFPQVDWLLKGHSHGLGFEDGWLRDLRVCHREMYERYFVMTVPSGDIPVAVVNAVLDSASDRTKLAEQLVVLNKKNLLVPLLRRLDAYKKSLDLAHAETFATALFDVGDVLPTDFGGVFGASADLIACQIIHHYLMQDTDRGRRSQILLKAIENTSGTWLPVRLVSIEEPRPEEKDLDKTALDDEGLARAKLLCLDKIRRLASNGHILGPRLGHYLWRWFHWGGEHEPRAWVAQATDSLEGMLVVLDGLVQQIHVSSGQGNFVSYELKLSTLATFIDVETVRTVLAPLFADSLSEHLRGLAEQHRVTISAVRKAFRRQAEGRADDDWGHDDE